MILIFFFLEKLKLFVKKIIKNKNVINLIINHISMS